MTEPRDLEPVTGAHGAEALSSVAVAEWLLFAAPDTSQALQDWRLTGTTVLPCGDSFSAVRIPAAVVQAAANRREPAAIAERLVDALLGGPVVVSTDGTSYFALTPSAGPVRQLPAGIEYLGQSALLMVPRPDLTDPRLHGHASYWAVPMLEPGNLCQLDAALQLAAVGRHRHLTKGTEQ
ncbi:hypothetical protein [Streptomyces sp. NPDC088794]|uniref:hypothetical protein n=1 Tax=Streptomyces sp. NPDC088794 TaxID=3365902 RepID=UPI0037F3DAFB